MVYEILEESGVKAFISNLSMEIVYNFLCDIFAILEKIASI